MTKQHETGFVARTMHLHDTDYRYTVWIPADYDPAKRWPAILFLHGKGECGTDGELHTTVGLGRAIRANPERFPAIVVMPQMPKEHRWEGDMLDLAEATLDAACQEYNIDPDRITLTGLSLGGFGTWALGARHPERFCALLPVCGGGDPKTATVLAKLPIWCFHGDADPVVPVERSREMVDAITAGGGNVRYSELPGVTHNSWDAAYTDPDVVQWMLSQHQ
ncbi:MAG: dienelactone hydrolase family protein [Phycisphaerae bacterium]|nr:dienelactone hydrolase family protein [Phycisphaerae bacterium]